MKLGTFMMPLHPPSRPAWQTLAEDREAIVLADRLGYCEALVGEPTCPTVMSGMSAASGTR